MVISDRPQVYLKYVRGGRRAPEYATAGSAAVDLRAVIDEPVILEPGKKAVLIPTGIALDFSAHPGMAGLILPRSSMGHNEGFVIGNTVGLIDSDYQGEIMVSCTARGPYSVCIQPMQRIAQLCFVSVLRQSFIVVDEFESQTERGDDGFGSTGKL